MHLYYYTSWDSGAVHFCPSGSSEWRDSNFEAVQNFPDWRMAKLDVPGDVEFVLRDDNGHWDNNNGNNYRLQNGKLDKEAWVLRNGRLGRVSTEALLIVSDLDRTLFGHEFDKPAGRVLDPDDKALSEFKSVWYERYAFGGSHLVYCTGRDKCKALKTLSEKRMPRPSLLICGVGTEIYEIPSDLPLCGGTWAEMSNSNRIKIIEKYQEKMSSFDRGSIWTVLREQFPRFKPYDDSSEKNPFRVSTVYPIDDNLPEGLAKESEQDFDRVIQSVREILGSHVQVIPSGNNGGWSCVDFCPQNAGKLAGLNFAIDFLRIEPSMTLACGDSGNDEGLYCSPGTRCVAVGNAMPALCDFLARQRRNTEQKYVQEERDKENERDKRLTLQKGEAFETESGSTVFYATHDSASGVLEALNHFWPVCEKS